MDPSRRPGALTILFKLPDDPVAVRLEGTLVRSAAAWAVELSQVPDEIHARLEAYVKTADDYSRPTLELAGSVLDELRRTSQVTDERGERGGSRWR